MMVKAFITTRDERRLQLWRNLFSLDRLPVKAAGARWQLRPLGPGREVYAYDLDASRLHPQARRRFAAYIAARARMPYQAAIGLVDGWPIQASGCRVVESNREGETAVSEGTAVSLRLAFAH